MVFVIFFPIDNNYQWVSREKSLANASLGILYNTGSTYMGNNILLMCAQCPSAATFMNC